MISLCLHSYNRGHHLKQTLAWNLKSLENFPNSELILFDSGSTDGTREWVAKCFPRELSTGVLKYYIGTRIVPFNVMCSKNRSHFQASKEILFNLDADNFVTTEEISWVVNKINNSKNSNALHLWSGEFGDGSCGKVVVAKSKFNELNGYNERLNGFGFEEFDLLWRIQKKYLANVVAIGNLNKRSINGVKYQIEKVNFKQKAAIQHARSETLNVLGLD